ncbi:RagB/SusD family nutrient uptake outer membrane protein [Winogradskyella maritima]|uniref:RagB/SusD family nutrient uptake outer membrane protein n=1 Tax=Winogradskyella maritima TaxID=1517766 RepID=A0ABV8ALA3_9FLAO|nr:RagB/SusD family nutrient uptake outer membrane protein [Winogradskyella maritima]
MKRIFLLIMLLNFTMACSDFLETEPELQISIDEQLSTREGVLQAYNGVYRDIEASFSAFNFVYADALGGNLTFTPSVTQNVVTVPDEIQFEYNFSSTPQNTTFNSYYENWYDIINQANLLLSNIENFEFFTEDEKNQLRAEMLVTRALSHYQISLLFAQHYGFSTDASHLGVVYNTDIIIAGEDFPSRETMAETYRLIQEDLDLALALFTNQQLQEGPSYSLFNTLTTSAIYARIALQMSDWQKALDYSSISIAQSGQSLMTQENYISEWEKPIDPVSEIILEFTSPRTSEGDVSSSISAYFQFNSSSNYGDYVASGDLLNLYAEDDIRGDLFIVQNLNTLNNSILQPQTYYFTKKFQDDAGTTFMRLSELYLIRSEANARLGNTSEALADLNSIRTRANLTELTDINTLLDDIFLERRRELAFEGFLLFDLARFNKDVERQDGCIAQVCDLGYPSNFFILPIPNDTVELNQNMQQNEGY